MDSITITIRSKGGIDKYPAKAHARRVAEQIGQQKGLIVLVGTRSALFSHSDMPQPFRQDRYFYYFSGCSEPNCVLTYDLAKDWLTLYLPQISWARFYYDGRGSTTEEAEASYDIDKARYISEDGELSALDLVLKQHRRTPGKLFLLNTSDAPTMARERRLDFDTLRPAADFCRAVKDEHEIKLIRKANEITAAAHKDVLLQLHECNSEADAEAIYLKRCIASLAKEQAYEPIFGAGENASFLHYIQDNKAFEDSQLLLIDAGCEWQRYASDVTRTVPLNSHEPGEWPSKEAEQIYKAVERVQERCIEEMKPGNMFSTVGKLAQDLVIDELLELGILRGEREDILRAGTHRAFFPHGLGHHMGLEVHDVVPPPTSSDTPCIIANTDSDIAPMPHSAGKRNTYAATACGAHIYGEPAMEPGNVITVEPGIYFNKFVLDRFFLPNEIHARYIDKEVLAKYLLVGGVRIEDDILITGNGNENLTTAPKGKVMLDIIRQASRRRLLG